MNSERADYITEKIDYYLYLHNKNIYQEDNSLKWIIEPEYIYDGSKLVIIIRE